MAPTIAVAVAVAANSDRDIDDSIAAVGSTGELGTVSMPIRPASVDIGVDIESVVDDTKDGCGGRVWRTLRLSVAELEESHDDVDIRATGA